MPIHDMMVMVDNELRPGDRTVLWLFISIRRNYTLFEYSHWNLCKWFHEAGIRARFDTELSLFLIALDFEPDFVFVDETAQSHSARHKFGFANHDPTWMYFLHVMRLQSNWVHMGFFSKANLPLKSPASEFGRDC